MFFWGPYASTTDVKALESPKHLYGATSNGGWQLGPSAGAREFKSVFPLLMQELSSSADLHDIATSTTLSHKFIFRYFNVVINNWKPSLVNILIIYLQWIKNIMVLCLLRNTYLYTISYYFIIIHNISYYFIIIHNISYYFIIIHNISYYFILFHNNS